MRVVANSIPKSGTHLLDRLLVLLGFRMVEGGIRPNLVSGRFRPVRRLLRGRGEKVTVGVVSPQQISRRWLAGRLSKVPRAASSTPTASTPQSLPASSGRRA